MRRDSDYGSGATDDQKAFVRSIVEKWRGKLFLHQFSFQICHESGDCADEPKCNADCTVQPEYHDALIRIYPKFWVLTHETEREFFILHEMCHVITAKQRALAFDALNEKLVRSSEIRSANEEATDWIANIVFSLTKEGDSTPPPTSSGSLTSE